MQSVQKRNNKTEGIRQMESTVSFWSFSFHFLSATFCIKVIFQRIVKSLSNFWKMGGVGGVDRMGERRLSFLFCNFVHCTCQVAHISWRHTSNGNSAIFGQVDGKFFSKSFNLKSQTSNSAYIIQKKSWLALLPRRRSKITLTKTIHNRAAQDCQHLHLTESILMYALFFEVLTCNKISAMSASKIDFSEISVVFWLKVSL